jgi:hypothetical protein
VTDKVQGTTVKDDDFMRTSRPITFEWGGKFLEAQQTIETYDIYLSKVVTCTFSVTFKTDLKHYMKIEKMLF